MKITYSNILTIGTKQIKFEELSEEQKINVANYLRRTPLEMIGTVRECKRETA